MIGKMRNPTLFEKIILIIGLFVMIIGFIMIKQLADSGGLNSSLLGMIFLWLILIMCIILVAVTEDVKEELRVIAENQVSEIKLLNEQTKLVREEIQLLRKDMGARTKKK